ncbi:MAG: hypothetical protein ABIH82_02430 [Candidatus Woesearchaeota archaeon]
MSEISELRFYHELKQWHALKQVPLAKDLFPDDSWYQIMTFIYDKVKQLYAELPMRKNGEEPFIHPINVYYFLSQASVNGEIVDKVTLAAGLLHDYVEEQVDYMNRNGDKVIFELEDELTRTINNSGFPTNNAKEIIEIVKLMTMEKGTTYYKYLSKVFLTSNLELKEKTIQIKLADRTHNVLCIECFNERERIYQCFKNLFLLNNVKNFLLDKHGEKMFTGTVNNVTEKLFNKCIKATYDAFIHIYHDQLTKGIYSINSMLQMAFKKFVFLNDGLEIVTKHNNHEAHLTRLYHGIILKFDARLHGEFSIFNDYNYEEVEYCRRFFSELNFSNEQLQAIVDYKDAYAFKETLARLLYKPSYFMSLFVANELSKEGRIV